MLDLPTITTDANPLRTATIVSYRKGLNTMLARADDWLPLVHVDDWHQPPQIYHTLELHECPHRALQVTNDALAMLPAINVWLTAWSTMRSIFSYTFETYAWERASFQPLWHAAGVKHQDRDWTPTLTIELGPALPYATAVKVRSWLHHNDQHNATGRRLDAFMHQLVTDMMDMPGTYDTIEGPTWGVYPSAAEVNG
jgi:hypothetical protein